jgi:hypothetical protein
MTDINRGQLEQIAGINSTKCNAGLLSVLVYAGLLTNTCQDFMVNGDFVSTQKKVVNVF